MPTYRLTFRPMGAWQRRPLLLDLDADRVDVEPSGQVALWQVQPRRAALCRGFPIRVDARESRPGRGGRQMRQMGDDGGGESPDGLRCVALPRTLVVFRPPSKWANVSTLPARSVDSHFPLPYGGAVEVATGPYAVTVRLIGEADLASSLDVRVALEAAVAELTDPAGGTAQRRSQLVLDATGLTDLRGLDVLLETIAASRRAGAGVTVVGANRVPRHLWRIFGSRPLPDP